MGNVKKGWKVVFQNKMGMLTLLMILISVYALAQSGQTGIEKADQEVRGYFKAGVKLMYAVGALVGLIGAIKVYQKWNGGDPDTSKVASAWFGSCIFLVVVAAIISAFFGVS
jgi:hypothetical protein